MKYIKSDFIKSSVGNSEVIDFLFQPKFTYEYKGDNLEDFDNYFTDDVLKVDDVSSSLEEVISKFLSDNVIKLEGDLTDKVEQISLSWNKEDFNLVVSCELAEGVIAEEILPELKEVIIDQVAKNIDSEEVGKQEVFAIKSDDLVEFFSDKGDAEKRAEEIESESYEVVEGEVTIFVSFDELKSAVVNERAITSKREIQSSNISLDDDTKKLLDKLEKKVGHKLEIKFADAEKTVPYVDVEKFKDGEVCVSEGYLNRLSEDLLFDGYSTSVDGFIKVYLNPEIMYTTSVSSSKQINSSAEFRKSLEDAANGIKEVVDVNYLWQGYKTLEDKCFVETYSTNEMKADKIADKIEKNLLDKGIRTNHYLKQYYELSEDSYEDLDKRIRDTYVIIFEFLESDEIESSKQIKSSFEDEETIDIEDVKEGWTNEGYPPDVIADFFDEEELYDGDEITYAQERELFKKMEKYNLWRSAEFSSRKPIKSSIQFDKNYIENFRNSLMKYYNEPWITFTEIDDNSTYSTNFKMKIEAFDKKNTLEFYFKDDSLKVEISGNNGYEDNLGKGWFKLDNKSLEEAVGIQEHNIDTLIKLIFKVTLYWEEFSIGGHPIWESYGEEWRIMKGRNDKNGSYVNDEKYYLRRKHGAWNGPFDSLEEAQKEAERIETNMVYSELEITSSRKVVKSDNISIKSPTSPVPPRSPDKPISPNGKDLDMPKITTPKPVEITTNVNERMNDILNKISNKPTEADLLNILETFAISIKDVLNGTNFVLTQSPEKINTIVVTLNDFKSSDYFNELTPVQTKRVTSAIDEILKLVKTPVKQSRRINSITDKNVRNFYKQGITSSKQLNSRFYQSPISKYTLSEAAQYMAALFFDLRSIHFLTTGNEFYTYHKLAEDLYEQTEDYYDDLIETAIGYDSDISAMYVLPGDWDSVNTDGSFNSTAQVPQTLILDRLEKIYDVLESVKDYDSMVKSKIDAMLEYYDKEIYKLKQAVK